MSIFGSSGPMKLGSGIGDLLLLISSSLDPDEEGVGGQPLIEDG